MEKFKDLSVPSADPSIDSIYESLQDAYCNSTQGNCLITCEECLYDNDNIEVFKEWYKLQKRTSKLERICL